MSTEARASTSTFFPPPIRISQLTSAKSSTASPSPSPSKRRRLGSISSSSFSTPTLDDEDDLYRKRYNASLGVLSFWNSLEAKYARDLADDDIVDLFTEEIIQDKGVIRGQPERRIGSFAGATSSNTGERDGASTPASLGPSDDEVDEAQEEEVDEDDFEGWSNVPDQFSRSLASPRKPLFGTLPPPTSSTTEEEDLAAFLDAERARWEREGDFDAELDARLREERSKRRARSKATPLSSASEVSLSTVADEGVSEANSDDELNIGYTPSPRKPTARSSRPSLRKLDLDSGEDDGREVHLEMYGSDDDAVSSDLDPLNLFDVASQHHSGAEEESSADELLIGPPVPRPKARRRLARPMKVEMVEENEEPVLRAENSESEIELDPIVVSSPPRLSPPAQRKYPTPLSPFAPSARKVDRQIPPPRAASPPPPRPQLWTPPPSTSSVEPLDIITSSPKPRNASVKASSPQKPRYSPVDLSTLWAPSDPIEPISPHKTSYFPKPTAPFSPPSSKGKERAFDFDFDFFASNPLSTPSVEPNDSTRPSSIRRGTPSPAKSQRVLQFDPIPQYDSDDTGARESRAKSPPAFRSPSPSLPPPPPLSPTSPKQKRRETPKSPKRAALGKRKRARSPESPPQPSRNIQEDTEDESGSDVAERECDVPQKTRKHKPVVESDSERSSEEEQEPEPEITPVKSRSRSRSRARRAPSQAPSVPSTSTAAPAPPPALPPYLQQSQPQPMMYAPPQPQYGGYQPYGYPQYAPSTDQAMLSSVIQSLNYLAFNGYNSPSPMSSPHHHHHPHPFMSPPPPPMFSPPQPQWPSYPQPQYTMPHPMPVQPFWHQMAQAPLVAQPPFQPPPQLQPPPLPQPQPQPSEEAPPRTPRRRRTSGQGAGEAGPSKRTADAFDEVFSSRASRQTPQSTRHSSLSPRKGARKSTASADRDTHSHSRSKSQSVSRGGPFDDEPTFASPSRKNVQHGAVSADGDLPFATPRKIKSASSPQKAGLARHNSAPSAEEMQRTPKRSNPSPLRRSITASDLFEGRGGGGWPRSEYPTDDGEADDFDPPDSPSRRSNSRGGRSDLVANPTAKHPMRVAVELPKISSRSSSTQRIFG